MLKAVLVILNGAKGLILYVIGFFTTFRRAYKAQLNLFKKEKLFDINLIFLKATGWNGYDFIINRMNPKGNKVIVEKNVGGRWVWEAIGKSKFAVNNNKLEIEINKQLLDLMGNDIDIEFKWNDNMQENGNIMDFYVNGDTAPGGRFNFVYSTLIKK